MKQETGAPANAKLLESHAADAERDITEIKKQRSNIREQIAKLDGDIDAQKPFKDQISDLGDDLEKAYDLWFKLSRQVKDYDKAVSEQRRDGEKIAKVEVERLLTQSWRFQRHGRERFIVSIAQDSIHCKDEMEFHAKYADSIRECEANLLRGGIENEKFPEWVVKCYEDSL